MEYIDGISLRKYIEQQRGVNVKEAVYLFNLILKGIKELHSLRDKIIHRDLKPENILLTKDLMNLKIIDLGISSVVATSINDPSRLIQTNEMTPFGTYPYVCPDFIQMFQKIQELKKNHNETQIVNIASRYITEQFDFYSLGVIFYEMLVGEKPFYAEDYTKSDVVYLPLKYDIMCMNDIDPNIPSLLENIIFRCLSSKPSDIKYRYTNINEIISDLDKYNKDPKMAMIVPLLKPKNKRTLQLKGIFNIEGQKTKEKIYEKH
jgi:serine/threonine-protein kinase